MHPVVSPGFFLLFAIDFLIIAPLGAIMLVPTAPVETEGVIDIALFRSGRLPNFYTPEKKKRRLDAASLVFHRISVTMNRV